MESIAHHIWGTSFFLDVGLMIPCLFEKDIQYLAGISGFLVLSVSRIFRSFFVEIA